MTRRAGHPRILPRTSPFHASTPPRRPHRPARARRPSILVAGIVGPLPGPEASSSSPAVVVLRNSRRARGLFARAKRRWPRLAPWMWRCRRPSALRRRARRKAGASRTRVDLRGGFAYAARHYGSLVTGGP
ncbi:hypothetical protein AB5I41_16230 [Sphingomonas sp. MMS24-JH45]